MFILWNYEDDSESGGFVIESFHYEESSETLLIKGNEASFLKLVGSDSERIKDLIFSAFQKNHNSMTIEFPVSLRSQK